MTSVTECGVTWLPASFGKKSAVMAECGFESRHSDKCDILHWVM